MPEPSVSRALEPPGHPPYPDGVEAPFERFPPNCRSCPRVVSELANIRFTGLEDVLIESSPIGQPGRAVRVFPNGSFDGYVPLAVGKNLITITGRMENGETRSATRTVYFERPSNPSPADELAAEELRETLQDRKVEIELLAEMRRAGPPQMRQLTVEVVDSPEEEPPKAAP